MKKQGFGLALLGSGQPDYDPFYNRVWRVNPRLTRKHDYDTVPLIKKMNLVMRVEEELWCA